METGEQQTGKRSSIQNSLFLLFLGLFFLPKAYYFIVRQTVVQHNICPETRNFTLSSHRNPQLRPLRSLSIKPKSHILNPNPEGPMKVLQTGLCKLKTVMRHFRPRRVRVIAFCVLHCMLFCDVEGIRHKAVLSVAESPPPKKEKLNTTHSFLL